MRRNVFTNTAVVDTAEENDTAAVIPDECKTALIKAMKIGYYKEFFKQGLITAEQLEQLIAMQDKNKEQAAA